MSPFRYPSDGGCGFGSAARLVVLLARIVLWSDRFGYSRPCHRARMEVAASGLASWSTARLGVASPNNSLRRTCADAVSRLIHRRGRAGRLAQSLDPGRSAHLALAEPLA